MKPIAAAIAELSEDVRAELLRPVEAHDPRNAQIVEGKTPGWYVVEVFANMQNDVTKELVEHRFGVYVPEVDETVIKRGRKIDRRMPMFVGYLFVFMWDHDQHRNWIINTPGVVAIVGWLSDAEIDIIRGVENKKRPVFIELPQAEAVEAQPRKKSKKKRWSKKGKSLKAKAAKAKVITEADLLNEIITTRAWSAFDDIPALDSEGRNQTLMRALGLS